MNKILDIRKFSASLSNQRSDFFLGISQTGTDGSPVLDFTPQSDKNWSNQELSEFYRVKDILAKYNISVVIDSGLTDELDPWFVYCNHHGDVFAHFCKIDRVYYLDSPKLMKPVTATNLRELVNRFSGDQIENNKKLEDLKGNVVILHPAILFTSLILALYVTTDAATSSAHAETLLPADTDLIHLKPVQLSGDAAGQSQTSKASAALRVIDDHKAIVKNVLTKLDQKEAAFYISIASIAGIASYVASSLNISEQFQNLIPMAAAPSTSEDGSLQQKHTLETAEVSQSAADANGLFLTNSKHSNLNDTIQVSDEMQQAGQLPVIKATDVSTRSANEITTKEMNAVLKDVSSNVAANGSLVPQTQDALSKVGIIDARPEFNSTNEPKLVQSAAAIDHLKDGLISININTSTISTVSINSSSDASFHILDSLSKVDGFNTILSSTGIADTRMIKIDYSINYKSNAPSADNELNAVETTKSLAGPYTADGITASPNTASSNLQAYTDQVRLLIDFVLAKGDQITIVNLPKEVIFVDNTALGTASDMVTARSWVTKDGGVISMVGFLKDISDFKVLQS